MLAKLQKCQIIFRLIIKPELKHGFLSFTAARDAEDRGNISWIHMGWKEEEGESAQKRMKERRLRLEKRREEKRGKRKKIEKLTKY